MAVELVNLLIASVLLAGVYATMSYGMALIYGVMKIVNLAHAGFMMLGAYVTLELVSRLQVDGIVAAVVLAPAFFAAGVVVYLGLVRRLPFSDQPTLPSLLLLFGVWLVLQNLGYVAWGPNDRSLFTPLTLATWNVGPLVLPVVRVAVFGVAVVSLVALQQLLGRTWFGRAVRAVSQNREAALLAGVDATRTAMLTFGLGVAFAGLAGGLLANLYSFNPDFGRPFLLRAFVIIVLGGMESFAGVALGALVVAVVETFSVLVVPASYQLAISFLLLVVAMVVLPGGFASLWQKGGATRWRALPATPGAGSLSRR